MHDNDSDSSRSPRKPDEEDLSDVEDEADVQHSLLRNDQTKDHMSQGKSSYEMTAKGLFRAYWLGVVVCIGGFLCMVGPKQNTLLVY